MGRHRKKPQKQPSIIDTDLNNQFSPSDQADTESDSSLQSTHSHASAPAPTLPQKRLKPHQAQAPVPDTASTVFTYMASVFAAAKMKKAVSKWFAKNPSFQLQSTEPWDTLKAQILTKISTALNPSIIEFTDYEIMFYITRIISKPGIPLTTEVNYSLLQQKASGKVRGDPVSSTSPSFRVTLLVIRRMCLVRMSVVMESQRRKLSAIQQHS
jgi:hypothetical protein